MVSSFITREEKIPHFAFFANGHLLDNRRDNPAKMGSSPVLEIAVRHADCYFTTDARDGNPFIEVDDAPSAGFHGFGICGRRHQTISSFPNMTSKNGMPFSSRGRPEIPSELNNLLQIISNAAALIENIREGTPASEKYFAMLRASVERAEEITAQLVERSGGSASKVLIHPDLTAFTRPKSTAPPRPRKPCILVVDDEEHLRALAQMIFSEAGFEVVTAKSGFECLDFFRRRPRHFHLILLDLTMPMMNGEETFERLRAISTDVPVVLMTGFIGKEQLQRMLSGGLAGYLRKPHGSTETLSYCKAIIDNFRLSRGSAVVH
jgi:CheY-like chemotaxis protein